MRVQLTKLRADAVVPRYMTDGAAGMDLCAALDQPMNLTPGMRLAISTGLAIAIAPGFEGQVRPRSGLARDFGVTVLNAPGTIDSDYRGEVKVLLVNLSHAAVTIEPGQRIAQLVIAPVVQAELEVVDELPGHGARRRRLRLDGARVTDSAGPGAGGGGSRTVGIVLGVVVGLAIAGVMMYFGLRLFGVI